VIVGVFLLATTLSKVLVVHPEHHVNGKQILKNVGAELEEVGLGVVLATVISDLIRWEKYFNEIFCILSNFADQIFGHLDKVPRTEHQHHTHHLLPLQLAQKFISRKLLHLIIQPEGQDQQICHQKSKNYHQLQELWSAWL
jgi:hypothetical protein